MVELSWHSTHTFIYLYIKFTILIWQKILGDISVQVYLFSLYVFQDAVLTTFFKGKVQLSWFLQPIVSV